MYNRFKKYIQRWIRTRTQNVSAKSLTEFWQKDSMKNIVPPGTTEPEGWDVKKFLSELEVFREAESVVEIGCGFGRLSAAFSPDKYLGIDINPEAVSTAKNKNMHHQYKVINYDDSYPKAEVGFAYTVLLHVSDELIDNVTSRIAKSYDKFIVAEILGRKWRSPGQRVPVFNRDQDEYIKVFSKHGMTLGQVIEKEYVHYPNTNISFLIFSK